MKRPSALVLLLVLWLAACQGLPPPIVTGPQAGPPPGRPQQEAAAPASAPSRLLDPELGQKLQAALEAAAAGSDIKWPGVVLHVRAPGLGAWSGAAGLGDVATKTTMRPNDRFRAGSLTKPFIASVVLQLVEEGRFALDDPISTLLPAQVAGKFPNADQITVRMLLNHTSGLAEFMDPAGPEIVAHLDKVWKVEEFLDLAAAQKPRFAPGTSQHYTNTNYLLLGMIIEKAAGRPWRQEVRERIFEPLNLHDTYLPAPEETAIAGDHAHGYADFGAGVFDATESVTASVVGAAGGQSLITNAPDLATFMEALLAGRLFHKSGTLDEMLTFLKLPAGEFPPGHPLSTIATEYGLGLMKATYGGDVTGIGHSGDTEGGYHAFVFHFPDQKITISGAVNTTDALAGWVKLMPRVLELLVPGYKMPQLSAARPDAAAALQGLLDDQVRKQGLVGMIMAVRLPDGTVVSRSSGSTRPAGKEPWRLDTVSALGSITKSFTAVVIMQLIQEGKVSLDDTIDKWFPDQPNGDKITVRMLLSHTSGLAGPIPVESERDPKWSHAWAPQDLVAEANRRGPVDKPGTRVAHYSNTNYFLLGMIIEKITGNPLHQEMRSRIIEPLHLEHTAFVGDEGIRGGSMVEGYLRTTDGYSSTLELPSMPHTSLAWAVGDVVSSAGDLLTFASALFDGTLVSKETLALMATPLGTDTETGRLWGLGGATLDTLPSAFGMGGENPGYQAFYVGVQNSKLVVAALANTHEADVISPSLMALDYLRSLPPGGQQPVTPAP